MGDWAQTLPKRDLCFPTGWGEIREFTSYPDSQTDKTVLSVDFFLSPGHSPQTLGKGGTNNWNAWDACCSWCCSLRGRACLTQEGDRDLPLGKL